MFSFTRHLVNLKLVCSVGHVLDHPLIAVQYISHTLTYGPLFASKSAHHSPGRPNPGPNLHVERDALGVVQEGPHGTLIVFLSRRLGAAGLLSEEKEAKPGESTKLFQDSLALVIKIRLR